MKKKIRIICTLGPSSLNKKFLRFADKKVSLLRLNMSHINLLNLKRSINFIKKHSNIPICIDTEGAQIRIKARKNKLCKLGQKIKISNSKKGISLYPEYIYNKIKVYDILNIGFKNLKLKVIEKKNNILCKVVSSGMLENNKGVHLENRHLQLNYLTKKDLKAIDISKKLKINNFALSFTNSKSDILKFDNLINNKNKIFKIETLKAANNFFSLLKHGNNFLIDRGDLSKDVSVDNMPIVLRNLFKIVRKFKNKNIFVATNLLEGMLKNNYPSIGEANDIFNSLEMGASGLVLAAETAIGKHPIDTVRFLEKIINAFEKSKKT
jgi:pyruvate kinase